MSNIMEQKFDICIVGMWYGINYGSVLTAYALFKTVRDLGYTAIMANKPKQLWNDHFYSENSLANRFAKKYLITAPVFDDYNDNKKLNLLSDTFIVGCDTLWHYPLVKTIPTFFFLDFVKDSKKKISYASSFGRGFDAPDYIQEDVNYYLNRFDAVSSREKEGVITCKDLFNVDATQVIDPVFLVNRQHYSELARSSKISKRSKYVLAYILDPNPDKISTIKLVCESLGCECINIVDPNNEVKASERLSLPVERNLDIEDWLKLFEDSVFIITDSYHGLCFSLIFNKDFICFGNKARGLARFTSLLRIIGLEHRICFDYNDVLGKREKLLSPIDYGTIKKSFADEIRRCTEWLSNALKKNKKDISKSISQLDRDLCCGCSACINTCPAEALRLIPDKYGYYRATIDRELCINCGKCANVCPSLHLPKKNNEQDPCCYAFIAADKELLFKSSSGGIFSLLAKEIFNRGGTVVGAAWQEDFSVAHILIDKEADLYKLQKSKYLQSYIGDVFKKVKTLLINQQQVLFSGCPCQVAGLKSFLGKNYTNLITVDLLCGNSPSPMFFKKYIDEEFSNGIKGYEFRNKHNGWNADCVSISNGTTTIIRRGAMEDGYQRVYHNHTMCPRHCELCKFQNLPRFGDLTIGDFWGLSEKDKSIDTKSGVSAVLCNNEKGKDFFESLPSDWIQVKKKVPHQWLGGNGFTRGHNWAGAKRNLFYKAILTMPFSAAANYALKPDHGNYLQSSSKTVLKYQPSFIYNTDFWSEYIREGEKYLIVRNNQWNKKGRFASLSLYENLSHTKKYRFHIKFRIKTNSSIINFHIKDSGTNILQVIFSKNLTLEQRNGVFVNDVSGTFVPKSDIFDEFSIGALHVSGDDNFIIFEKIIINEDA